MKTNKLITWLGGLFLVMLLVNSCEDSLDGTTFFTTDGETDEMTITEVLEANPEKFSMYVEILKKAEYYNAFKSYGDYTCFVPTNTAVKTFIEEKWNVTSIEELTSEDQIEFLKMVVQFHTLPTRRRTSGFIEGRIDELTFSGDYLTTSFVGGGGIANVTINREAKLDQYDIEANNGVIQGLDAVLPPFIEAIPKIMEDTGKYSIFIEALKQTGYYDEFSKIYDENGVRINFTILAESDEIYSENNINSFADLAAVISPSDSDYTNVNNALNRFIGYHAASDFYYSSDFPDDAFISTILPNNALKSSKLDSELKINETETGVNDTWVSLIAAESNLPGKNGVYHTVNKLLTIFIPKAKYQLFDFTLAPSIGKLSTGKWYGPDEDRGPYTNPRMYPENAIRILRQTKNPSYDFTIFNSGAFTWVEFDTPVLPKGKYEVRVSGNQGNNGRPVFQIYWDGDPIGKQWDMRDNLSDVFGSDWANVDSLTMREAGYVRGFKDIVANTGVSAYDNGNFGRFIVTSDLLCPVQQSHVIRLETVRSGGAPIDFVEFVPVD